MSPTSYRTAPPRAKVNLPRATCTNGCELGFQICNPNPAIRNLLVGLGRFELPTSRLSGVRSNQLSYRPMSLLRDFFAKKSHTSRSAVRSDGGRAQGRVASVANLQLPAIYFC